MEAGSRVYRARSALGGTEAMTQPWAEVWVRDCKQPWVPHQATISLLQPRDNCCLPGSHLHVVLMSSTRDNVLCKHPWGAR